MINARVYTIAHSNLVDSRDASVNLNCDSNFKVNLQIIFIKFRVCLDITYFTETENWKYCSKIIFKCVNSIVGPIFNEKVAEKWNLWVREQCTNALFIVEKSTFVATVQWTMHEQ